MTFASQRLQSTGRGAPTSPTGGIFGGHAHEPPGHYVGTQMDGFSTGGDSAVTALTVMHALVFMAAAHPVVPLRLLHMLHVQRLFGLMVSLVCQEAQAALGYPTPLSAG